MTANIHPAPIELAALAAVMRPDWDRTQLEGAIAGAREAWPWQRIFAEVARLLVMEDSSPHDLTVAARDQRLTRRPADPSETHRWAADAREYLARTRNAS